MWLNSSCSPAPCFLSVSECLILDSNLCTPLVLRTKPFLGLEPRWRCVREPPSAPSEAALLGRLSGAPLQAGAPGCSWLIPKWQNGKHSNQTGRQENGDCGPWRCSETCDVQKLQKRFGVACGGSSLSCSAQGPCLPGSLLSLSTRCSAWYLTDGQ